MNYECYALVEGRDRGKLLDFVERYVDRDASNEMLKGAEVFAPEGGGDPWTQVDSLDDVIALGLQTDPLRCFRAYLAASGEGDEATLSFTSDGHMVFGVYVDDHAGETYLDPEPGIRAGRIARELVDRYHATEGAIGYEAGPPFSVREFRTMSPLVKRLGPDGDYVFAHPHPVWRERGDSSVAVDISYDWTSDEWEELWARRLDDVTFEICCVPYRAYDIGPGDTVEIGTEGSRDDAVLRVVSWGGSSVFSVWPQCEPGSEQWLEFVDTLEGQGAMVEDFELGTLGVASEDGETTDAVRRSLRWSTFPHAWRGRALVGTPRTNYGRSIVDGS